MYRRVNFLLFFLSIVILPSFCGCMLLYDSTLSGYYIVPLKYEREGLCHRPIKTISSPTSAKKMFFEGGENIGKGKLTFSMGHPNSLSLPLTATSGGGGVGNARGSSFLENLILLVRSVGCSILPYECVRT